MRIIAGIWRSRRLVQPATESTRPMPDRVKEAIFSILGTMYDTLGSLPALHVADVFAGSGSMGLEALSRGAATCYFFESQPIALDALKKNLASLEAGPAGTIITRDAWSAVIAESRTKPFDLLVLDPPYRDSQDWQSGAKVPKFLLNLANVDGPKPLVVLHREARTKEGPELPAPWQLLEHRVYGTNAITFLKA